jgi:hypothetical protein
VDNGSDPAKDSSSCQDLRGKERGAEEEPDGSATAGNSSVPFPSSLFCTQDSDRGSSIPLIASRLELPQIYFMLNWDPRPIWGPRLGIV